MIYLTLITLAVFVGFAGFLVIFADEDAKDFSDESYQGHI
jgi:hypothetical protein